jgi:tight adherence protein B
MMPWMLLLVFLGTSALAFAVLYGKTRMSRTVQRRIGQLGGTGGRSAASQPRPGERVTPYSNSSFAAAATAVSAAGGRGSFTRQDYLPFVTHALENRDLGETLKLELVRAGLRLRPSEFVLGVVLSTCFCPAIALIFTRMPLILIGAAILGLIVPFLVLKAMQASRLARFAAQLPDALTLIASSIRSGYSFMRAIQVVSEQMVPPISLEFERVLKETNLGSPTEVAFANMVRRVPSYDLDLVVTAVVIQQQVGGNLAEIMDTIAGTIRERVKLQREIAALTAEGKLSGWICFVMPFFMLAIMTALNGEYMRPLFESPQGLMMIWIALALQFMGGVIIKKMLSVDV